jgi:cobalamin-dependent methionine synthase I
LPKANAPAVPSVFRNTPPADAEDEALRPAPEDWRAQTAEQKAAINQFHIARIAEHFRHTGARVKQHAEDLPLDQRLANYIIEGTKDGLIADLDRKRAEDWGFPDAPTVTMHDRFTSKYHGKRYSFGYPACSNLDDQHGVFKVLRPEDIGVQLTEGMMMEPEASVSAIVFHHPDCAYFTADDGESGAAA